MASEQRRVVMAASACTVFAVAGVFSSAGAFDASTVPPESLTPKQAEEACREVEKEVERIREITLTNPLFETTRERRETMSEEREKESSERETEVFGHTGS